MTRRRALVVKRLIDLVGASIGFVALSPVMAWTALGIAVTLGRPIIFRQERPGLHGKLFEIVKFRTMRPPRRGEVWYMTDDSGSPGSGASSARRASTSCRSCGTSCAAR